MSGILLDIIVVVVAVLLLIFGLWRGMFKMIFGLVSSLLALILTIVLLSSVTTFVVEKTLLDDKLREAIDQPLTEAFPNSDVAVRFYDFENDGTADELGYEADGEVHKFADLLAGTPYSLLAGTLESIISGRLDEETTEITFINALSSTIVGYIVTAIVFVVLLIIFAIIVRILMALVNKFVTHTYVGHFFNKILGGVLGLVLAVVIIFGSLAVIRFLGTYDWIIPVNRVIEDSTLTKLLFDNNIIYNFLVDNFNIQNLIDSIISRVSGGTASAG